MISSDTIYSIKWESPVDYLAGPFPFGGATIWETVGSEIVFDAVSILVFNVIKSKGEISSQYLHYVKTSLAICTGFQ